MSAWNFLAKLMSHKQITSLLISCSEEWLVHMITFIDHWRLSLHIPDYSSKQLDSCRTSRLSHHHPCPPDLGWIWEGKHRQCCWTHRHPYQSRKHHPIHLGPYHTAFCFDVQGNCRIRYQCRHGPHLSDCGWAWAGSYPVERTPVKVKGWRLKVI